MLQIIIAIGTVGLAVFTALMWWSTRAVAFGTATLGRETTALARETANLARETLAASALADQHHQESMTPIIVLEDAVVDSPGHSLNLTGLLRNIGAGVALDVRVWIGELGQPINVGPIGSGQAKRISCAVTIGDTVRQKQPIKIVLLYTNLFKSEAKTEHHGNCHVKDSFNAIFHAPPVVARISPDKQ